MLCKPSKKFNICFTRGNRVSIRLIDLQKGAVWTLPGCFDGLMSSRILEPSGQKLELDVSNDAYSLGEQLLYWEGGGQRPSRGWKWPKTPHWSPGRPVRSCPAYCQALIGRRVVYPVLADVMQSCTPIAHQPNQRRCVKELCFFRKELCYCVWWLNQMTRAIASESSSYMCMSSLTRTTSSTSRRPSPPWPCSTSWGSPKAMLPVIITSDVQARVSIKSINKFMRTPSQVVMQFLHRDLKETNHSDYQYI